MSKRAAAFQPVSTASMPEFDNSLERMFAL